MSSANVSYKKSSFGPAFFFLSKRRRAALAAYYEFCRRVDDIVDEPSDNDPFKQLDFWQAEVERIFNHTATTELGKELTQVVDEFGLTPDRFLLLIEGMRADLQGRTYDTLRALEWYLYRVAVIVGLATLDIMDVKGPQAEALAKALGGAVQLTNIIRDVPADANLGRVYLPQTLLTRYRVSREDVLAGRQPKRTARVLVQLHKTACRLYAAANVQMNRLPRLKMLPCRMIACVYAKNLAKIKKTGFVFVQPIKLTKTEKVIGAFHALLKTLVG